LNEAQALLLKDYREVDVDVNIDNQSKIVIALKAYTLSTKTPAHYYKSKMFI
jgi:hypothetical protein